MEKAARFVGDLRAALEEGNRTVLLGAPAIRKSPCLDELDETGEAVVVRSIEAIESAEPGVPLVLDDFYDLFSSYCRTERTDREKARTVRRNLITLLDGETPVLICTTPYRLRWILSERRENFEDLFGEPTEWTVEPISVNEPAAKQFLEHEVNDEVDCRGEYLAQTEWEYPLAERFQDCLSENESDDAFLETETYTTLRPNLLVGASTRDDIEDLLNNQRSLLGTVGAMLGDVSASGTLSGVKELLNESDEDKGLLNGAREFADTLRDQGMYDTVVEEGMEMLSQNGVSLLGKATGAVGGAVVSPPPALAVVFLAYWAYATRQGDETREAVRKEFQSILGSDLLELSAAEREDIEEKLELEPKTLLYLNRAATGVTWEKLDRTMDTVEETIDRVDDLDSTVESHQEIIETIRSQLAEKPTRRKVYQTLDEFETHELYETPSYVSPSYEMKSESEFGPELTAGEDSDPRDDVVDLLDRAGKAVVLLTGESGVGKTRLMVEIAKRLEDRSNKTVQFVRDPPLDSNEPPITEDTVLFLDEVGRMENPEYFFGLASENRRYSGQGHTVQVVAAIRPIYEQDIERRAIPETVSRYDIRLNPLEAGQTVSLLSDVIAPERAREIHETTDGNPFLSRLLALAEGGADSDVQDPEEKIREDIFEETLVGEAAEADSMERGKEIEKLLTAVSILGKYDIGAVADSVNEPFDVGSSGTQESLLNNLSEAGYLNKSESDELWGNPTFTHQFDIFAEYLRYQDLVEEDEVYKRLFESCLSTNAVGFARGLVELQQSSLRRFQFVDEEILETRINRVLENVAQAVVERDVALTDMFEVQYYVALLTPHAIPHDALDERFRQETPEADTAKQLFRFITILNKRLELVVENDVHAGPDIEESNLPSGLSFSESRMWLHRLEMVAQDNQQNTDIQLELAKGLANAVKTAGKARRWNLMEETMDRLERVAQDNQQNAIIQLALAKGMIRTIKTEAEAERLNSMEESLDRLEAVARENQQNTDIQLVLAKGVVYAIKIFSKAGQWNSIEKSLDRLGTVAQDNQQNAIIQLALAKVMVNAIKFLGEAERWNSMEKSLEQLETMVEANEENADIQLELAKGVVNAIHAEAQKKRWNPMEESLDRLETVAHDNQQSPEIQLLLARGLFNVINAKGNAEQWESIEESLDQLKTVAQKTNRTPTSNMNSPRGCSKPSRLSSKQGSGGSRWRTIWSS